MKAPLLDGSRGLIAVAAKRGRSQFKPAEPELGRALGCTCVHPVCVQLLLEQNHSAGRTFLDHHCDAGAHADGIVGSHHVWNVPAAGTPRQGMQDMVVSWHQHVLYTAGRHARMHQAQGLEKDPQTSHRQPTGTLLACLMMVAGEITSGTRQNADHTGLHDTWVPFSHIRSDR